MSLLLNCWISVLVYCADFVIYRRAHNIFGRLELVLFLVKFIDVTLEIVKERAMGFSEALWSLRCRGVSWTLWGVSDGTFSKNKRWHILCNLKGVFLIKFLTFSLFLFYLVHRGFLTAFLWHFDISFESILCTFSLFD